MFIIRKEKQTYTPNMLRYLLFSSVLPVCAGLATPVALGTRPYYTVPVDYSAANEFIAEHYGLSQSYFQNDHATESIYNARQGYLDGDVLLQPLLSKCGFELVRLKAPASQNVDWDDLKSIRENYLPRVEEAIRSSLGKDCISDIFFWNPTIRSHDFKESNRNVDMEAQTTPRSIQAGMAHIDSDVNAYESIEQFLKVVAANVIPGTKPLPLDQVTQSLKDEQRRFAIFNAWCNIGSTKILQAPLAFMPMRYKQANTAFPVGQPDFEDSHWYTFPEMEPDELLLFAQYDRDAAQPSDVWHCALKGVGANEDVPPRKSFDVRAFVILKDNVPEHRDRLAQRVTSILDFKESQAFCAEQVIVTKKTREQQTASWRKREDMPDFSQGWMANILSETERNIAAAQVKYPDRVHVVNTTELILNPDSVMEEAYAFLGLQWRPEYKTLDAFNAKVGGGEDKNVGRTFRPHTKDAPAAEAERQAINSK